MNNEQEEVQETEQTIIEPEIKEEPVKEEIDYKAKFEEEQGRRKRLEKKLSKAETEEPDNKIPSEKKQKLDYGELAYLEVQGIKTDEEIDYLKGAQKFSGLELKDLLKKSFVQAELKTLRENKSVIDATPSATKRTSPGNSAKDSVEYWIKKDELPSDYELRIKVVNEKIRIAKMGNTFPTE